MKPRKSLNLKLCVPLFFILVLYIASQKNEIIILKDAEAQQQDPTPSEEIEDPFDPRSHEDMLIRRYPDGSISFKKGIDLYFPISLGGSISSMPGLEPDINLRTSVTTIDPNGFPITLNIPASVSPSFSSPYGFIVETDQSYFPKEGELNISLDVGGNHMSSNIPFGTFEDPNGQGADQNESDTGEGGQEEPFCSCLKLDILVKPGKVVHKDKDGKPMSVHKEIMVQAKLKDGSDPSLCTEGLWIASTAEYLDDLDDDKAKVLETWHHTGKIRADDSIVFRKDGAHGFDKPEDKMASDGYTKEMAVAYEDLKEAQKKDKKITKIHDKEKKIDGENQILFVDQPGSGKPPPKTADGKKIAKTVHKVRLKAQVTPEDPSVAGQKNKRKFGNRIFVESACKKFIEIKTEMSPDGKHTSALHNPGTPVSDGR